MSFSNIEYRYERKFLISELSRSDVEMILRLHPAVFSEIYHERFVNNIYFDSLDLDSYSDGVNGIANRIKVRIRWYGRLFGKIYNPVLELKKKNGLVGKKTLFSLNSFSLNTDFNLSTIYNIFRKLKIQKSLIFDLLSLQPTIINRYKRKYFQSYDKKYRITIDSDIKFFAVDIHRSLFLKSTIDSTNVILEVKYNSKNDYTVDKIVNYFPFRMTKNSKYVNGINALGL